MNQIQPKALPSVAKADFYDKLGQAHQLSGAFLSARKAFSLALSSYQEIRDQLGLSSIQKKLGDVCRQLEDFSRAKSWYTRAYNATHSPDSLCGIALSIRGMGHYTQALKILRQAEKLFHKIQDRFGLAYVHWAIGTTSRFAGQLKAAETHLRKSFNLYHQLRDDGGMAYAACGLGGTLRIQGKAKASFQLYRRASTIFRRLGDDFGLAYSLCGQGNSLRMQTKWSASIPFFKRAIALYQTKGMAGPRAFVLWNLSQSFIALGKDKEAKQCLKDAYLLFKRVHDRRGLVYILLGQGELYRFSRPNNACLCFRRAFQLTQKESMPLESLYAKRAISQQSLQKEFMRRGVHWPLFKKYRQIP